MWLECGLGEETDRVKMVLCDAKYGLDLEGKAAVGFTKQVKLREVGGAGVNTVGLQGEPWWPRGERFWKELEKRVESNRNQSSYGEQ